MIKIFWTATAINDIDNIFEYIARDSKIYAKALIEEIYYAVEQIQNFPKSGRIVPEEKKKNKREIFVGNYRIIYEIKEARIFILTVLHGVRNLKR